MGDQRGARAHAGGGGGSLAAGVTAADDDDVEEIVFHGHADSAWVCRESKLCVRRMVRRFM